LIRALFICLVISLASGTVQAATASQEFERANTSFESGNYHAAISQYESILATNGYSAAVLFNLGNAYYRDGQLGAAILNFERAQVLAPRDANIELNLNLARQKAGVSTPKSSEWEQWARILSPNTLAWIGAIALITICLTLGLGRFVASFSRVKVVAAVAGVALAGVSIAYAIRWSEFDRAVVIAANAPARIAPADTASASFTLKAGETVAIAKSYGQFVLARTSDGRSGWVSDQEIGRVFAPRFASGKHGEI
jgi:tetratricopeptide (TPR) repeat protein